jgi:integrase
LVETTFVEPEVESEFSKAHMDYSVERFLTGCKPSTASTYRCTIEKHFIPFLDDFEFQGRRFYTFKEVIDAISLDQALPVGQKVLLDREIVCAFGKYLEAKKQAPKSIVNRVGAIQSAAKFWGVTMTTRYTNLPDAEAQTESYDWTIPMIEKFNALLRTPKYRCLDAFLFQSGLGISDVLCRKWSEIKADYEAGITPCFKVTRGKTGVKHHTCIAKETTQLMKIYFDDKFGKGKTPEPDQRIFDLGRRPVDDIYANRAHMLIGSWPFNNPMGCHTKRKAFRNMVVGQGNCPSEYAEYYMGHELGADIKKTYSTRSVDGWRSLYDTKLAPFLHFQILDYEKVRKELKLDAKAKV